MSNIAKSPDVKDVCIIGSGASGGAAAYVLSKAGLKVVLLEAGPGLDPEKQFKQSMWPYEHPRRGATEDMNDDDFVPPGLSLKIPGEPYTKAHGTQFVWWRSRVLGGRTNHWGRHAFRFSPIDLRGQDGDGLGSNWPLTYDELAPYYDKVESFIGVFGTRENLPDYPDGVFMPAPQPRCTELFIKKACDKVGISCIGNRAAVLTTSLNGRPACHYCHQCSRGCKAGSAFTSTQVFLPVAAATGNLQIITEAMAREILVGNDGKVTGVSYIDKAGHAEQQIRARYVMLAAGTCESTRLLLNSRSKHFSEGLANSSGVVGRFLSDHLCASGRGFFPALESIPPHNHDGTGPPHLFITGPATSKMDFPRRYHIEFKGGRYLPFVGGAHQQVCSRFEGFGLDLKRRCRQYYGCHIYFCAVGEMVADRDSFCEIDPVYTDEWGIPILRFSFKRGNNEVRMAKHMHETIRSIVEAGGGSYTPYISNQDERPHGISLGGECFHEIGTVRMGNDPRHSAVNAYCQAHDVKNLFVIDGACFPSNPDKPSTLTIMALAWRAAEYLIEAGRA
jgi:choline dehydrogenase-like flavoprotein